MRKELDMNKVEFVTVETKMNHLEIIMGEIKARAERQAPNAHGLRSTKVAILNHEGATETLEWDHPSEDGTKVSMEVQYYPAEASISSLEISSAYVFRASLMVVDPWYADIVERVGRFPSRQNGSACTEPHCTFLLT